MSNLVDTVPAIMLMDITDLEMPPDFVVPGTSIFEDPAEVNFPDDTDYI